MRSIFRRLLMAGFWIGLCAAVVGAVILERRQIQRHDEVVAAQEAARLDPVQDSVNVAEHANVLGRSRASRMPSPKAEVEGFTVRKDVSYGAEPLQTLDVYSPNAPRADGKTLVFVHGGGLKSGSKDEYRYIGEALAIRGFTVIVPNYRLAPGVRFPAFVEDVARAVRWSSDHYGNDKLFLMGHSAGAYIVAMLAANTPYLADAGVNRTKLRGIIGLSGSYDLIPLAPEDVPSFGDAKDDPKIEPKTYAKLPLPPLLLIHGAGDKTALPQNSEHLAAAWSRVGAEVELKFYSNVAHMQAVESLGDTLPERGPTRDDVIDFMERH